MAYPNEPSMNAFDDIPRHIRDLLPSEGCVVIPGIGGFITHHRSALLDAGKNRLQPPAATVAFNPSLRSNDGVLANAIARADNIPYAKALEKVQEFAWECIRNLNAGHALQVTGLGELRLDELKNYNFIPDPGANFLDDSFGLNTVSAHPIRRSRSGSRHSVTTADRKPVRMRVARLWEGVKWTIMVMPILLLALYSVYQTGFLEGVVNYSSMGVVIPQENPHQEEVVDIAQSEPETMYPTQIRKSSFEEPQPSTETDAQSYALNLPLTGEDESIPLDSSAVTENENPNPEEAQTHQTSGYCIVAGCFRDEQRAKDYVATLTENGYNASLAGLSPSGLHRVSVASFPTEPEALQALPAFKEKVSGEVWILKL